MNILKIFSFFFLYISFLNAFDNFQESPSLQKAISEATLKKLSEHPQWLTLLHFVDGQSQIDDPSFFYAPLGQYDAKAELIATIEEFYHPLPAMMPIQEISSKKVSKHPFDTHALCRFQARFEFLNEQLKFENLPDITCHEYQNMLETINPKGVKIVFPAAHVSSPASMFGHTFLLFESAYRSTLLSYALNYAADADPLKENPFVFTFKGIFGLYEGRYSIAPYYDSLKEYKDTENRDVWEFKLNLNKQETLRAFKHMWELREVFSDYYFFDENCSYNLFWILEVARPSLKLRESFTYQVNPPETLFVMQEQNVIEDEYYRPSKRRVIEAYAKEFSYPQVQLIKKKALGEALKEEELPKDPDKKRLFLENILELSEYYYIQAQLNKEKYSETAHKIAMKRSQLGKGKTIKTDLMYSPLKGHRGVRFFAGISQDNHTQGLLGVRLAYHDLSESDRGFLGGTEIEFMDMLFAYDDKSVNIKDVQFLSLASLSPVSTLFQPISYRLILGMSDWFMPNELHAFARLGVGVTFNVVHDLLSYYLIEILNTHDRRTYLLGAMNTIGILYGGQKSYKLHMEYSNVLYTSFVALNIENRFKSTLSYHLTQNYAFFTEYQLRRFNVSSSYPLRHMFQAGLRVYY